MIIAGILATCFCQKCNGIGRLYYSLFGFNVAFKRPEVISQQCLLVEVVLWPMYCHTGIPCRRHKTWHPTPSRHTDLGPTWPLAVHWCGTVGSSVESSVPTGYWTRDRYLWCANPLRYPLAHSCFLFYYRSIKKSNCVFTRKKVLTTIYVNKLTIKTIKSAMMVISSRSTCLLGGFGELKGIQWIDHWSMTMGSLDAILDGHIICKWHHT